MAWSHLDIDKPHVAYIILGGFTSLFMLCSLFVKEKLYIGEATVATLCGVIFGPHAANFLNPISWGNVDKLTLEFSRIVLVVQCFAVGVELPKSYMERHWKSVALLLIPVMTWGWMMTSLFIWWMVPPLTWLESLICAACVTATDPVLASSVVGKGKFAKRVPKHLRDLLSAESGCNDGMAFPFIYLSLYILAYQPKANKVAFHWFCVTLLYECILGAFFGFMIGYAGRHAIKFAERKGLIDRESFLVFYFVLALFCAGTGSLLGMDDLLMGFSAGVGFSNDGWFTEKTEESHVSNVIDLLLNLTYFVYFGAIIPWQEFNDIEIGLPAWRLVVIAILVILFRRIPIMLLLKPMIPDIKTWREALFAGHFGPIGVGAIFACILARAELETHSTQPLDGLPGKGEHNYTVIKLIWPITTFLVISSILVHGSSVAVFTLGKRINTLTITMSYTTTNDEGPSWMNRLPRIQSQSKASLSLRKESLDSSSEGVPQFPPGTLGPIGIPGSLLRRQKEGDQPSQPGSRSSSRKPIKRKKLRAGGPISQSAITPQRRAEPATTSESTDLERGVVSLTSGGQSSDGLEGQTPPGEPEIEVYQEGGKIIIEDEEGNVLETVDISHIPPEEREQEIMAQHRRIREDSSGIFAKGRKHPHERDEGEEIKRIGEDRLSHPMKHLKKHFWKHGKKKDLLPPESSLEAKPKKERKRRSARAYQFAHTIIVEDEDGEVIKKYNIPGHKTTKKETQVGESSVGAESSRWHLSRMGSWMGRGEDKEGEQKPKNDEEASSDEERLRFTVPGNGGQGRRLGGRRMTKEDFIREIQQLDPKARKEIYDEDIPGQLHPVTVQEQEEPHYRFVEGQETPLSITNEHPSSITPGDDSTEREDVPSYDVAASLARYTGLQSSAAESRRRRFGESEESLPLSPMSRGRAHRRSEDYGTMHIPPAEVRHLPGLPPPQVSASGAVGLDMDSETPAERKRRLAALGQLPDTQNDGGNGRRADSDSSDSEDDGRPRPVKGKVSFADGTRPAKARTSAMMLSSAQAGSSSDVAEQGSSTTGNGNGNGNGNAQRGHASRISWGGERGRS
ncbi:Na+/H+ antiporter [Ophidiomyces ophidiicola]|uniref:Na+/H+ antiporter n=1 Tax=Ophidiomyces ophidiicola TaxID=1387563 RepID=A0ACB8V205_9EURO|nr:Na+/H+ antiporter [Ophidiomyces ophidiicola]KAI1973046.1 Na+/H+ antiporter [Ophidiomyces ophidiicola]KAI2006858.1 Na+/H+ antiporter [Ophidiomyces ophidiicola]KAI2025637.1 Na+/H+ antiporter [Ophidiomyces ophidiicola]KAI2026667.1 Na+/H+ antiporter [Ophidiomyces ophidiicola]